MIDYSNRLISHQHLSVIFYLTRKYFASFFLYTDPFNNYYYYYFLLDRFWLLHIGKGIYKHVLRIQRWYSMELRMALSNSSTPISSGLSCPVGSHLNNQTMFFYFFTCRFLNHIHHYLQIP